MANFMRSGCVSCKDEDGKSTHSGRNGDPIILIVGDEATPSVVGYTKVGENQGCSWVFKKEHLALQEVVGILRSIDTEKKE